MLYLMDEFSRGGVNRRDMAKVTWRGLPPPKSFSRTLPWDLGLLENHQKMVKIHCWWSVTKSEILHS